MLPFYNINIITIGDNVLQAIKSIINLYKRLFILPPLNTFICGKVPDSMEWKLALPIPQTVPCTSMAYALANLLNSNRTDKTYTVNDIDNLISHSSKFRREEDVYAITPLSILSAALDLGMMPHYSIMTVFGNVLRHLSWTGPVLINTSWDRSMNYLDKTYTVTLPEHYSQTKSYLVCGIDYKTQRVKFQNATATHWGEGACFYMSLADFSKLFKNGGMAFSIL